MHIRNDHEPTFLHAAVVVWKFLIFLFNQFNDFFRRKFIKKSHGKIRRNENIAAMRRFADFFHMTTAFILSDRFHNVDDHFVLFFEQIDFRKMMKFQKINNQASKNG